MKDTVIIGGRGYIGSALREVIDADSLDVFDDWNTDKYGTIILLAGHSSKPMGENRPDKAWVENVEKFKWLLDNLKDWQRLIYASSASVYNNIAGVPDETCSEFHPMNMYDLSKYVIDQLAILKNKHTYGLRFCTVNGYSPVLRVDLMLNKMVEDAKQLGKVTIKNGDLTRPILGMNDLVRAVKAIVDSKEDNRGIYNLKSFHDKTVREFAEAVTKKFGGVVEDLGDEPHYVFGADTSKFEKTYNFEFKDTLDSILESLTKEPQEKVRRV
jgi:Nucleoside-diphosphate-sugar epimerases